MKVLTVVGARPQFVKAAPVSRALTAEGIEEVLVHTGQHYDDRMSRVFFHELAIPAPRYHLGIGSGTPARQVGGAWLALEEVMAAEAPDLVLVYGDTHATAAGALCAAHLRIPAAHVEAGLRSFDRAMPEEVNRVVADHLSSVLLCPSETAVRNLGREGIREGVVLVGDVMRDALEDALAAGRGDRGILETLGLADRSYLLATLHRPQNVDDPTCLLGLVDALSALGEPVVLPLHPRTRAVLAGTGRSWPPDLLAVDPVGHVDMVRLEAAARLVLTDSGGVQKEAYWLGVPCLTLRRQTEWVETVEAGWNLLVGADPAAIAHAVRSFSPPSARPSLYGEPGAAARVAGAVATAIRSRRPMADRE